MALHPVYFCTGTTSCLFLHMQLLLFLFICAHPGKSWLGFMFSCTNRWFFAQALHPVYFLHMGWFICMHPGKSWLGSMFSCTGKCFIVQRSDSTLFAASCSLFLQLWRRPEKICGRSRGKGKGKVKKDDLKARGKLPDVAACYGSVLPLLGIEAFLANFFT
ncbi:hypothetical protein VPH35_101668 [Triticum aestivum]|uniref:Uncharacterized protein n=1 Tax=Aegilops tauschii subsp. strangulata TaxID=200361 RepID=A0A453MIJ4_AEGTS